MKLLGNINGKITKYEKGENVPSVTIINMIQESLIHLLLINHLVSY